MSNLETLLAAFQTQLSDVMETVLKTAMYEVTRLVEEGILEEVKRKGQEVQSLKMRLQWTEQKLNDEEISRVGQMTGRCVDCAKKGVTLSANAEKSNKQQDDVCSGSSVKEEETSVDRWTKGQTQNSPEPLSPEEDHLSVCPSPDQQTQDCHVPAPAEEAMESTADVKDEIVIRSSCSSAHVGVWASNVDGKAGLESPNTSTLKEKPPKQSEENGEELLRTIMKYSPQRSAMCSYPAEVEESAVSADVSGSEMDTSWTGLLQNHRTSPEKDFDALKTSSDSTPVNSLSKDPQATLQASSALGLTVKQEVILQSDQREGTEKEARSKFVLRPAKQHRQGSGSGKQNHVFHRAAVQEVMKLDPKSEAGLKLQAALHQLHRPIKKTPQSVSGGTAAALSLGHSPSASLNSIGRIPSTSKTTSPPTPSAQRPRLSDRQAAALGRNTASWLSIRSQHQSAGSNHSNPALHSGSHAGPRHLLRCGQCGKCFPHPSNLKAHLQTHTGERPFCCSLCGRSFTKLSNLKAHRRVHTGERPYCCPACGKRFTQKCNLKRHQRIHLDV